MKITKTPDMVRGSITAGSAGSIGGVIIGPPGPGTGGGTGIVSSSSNQASWQPIISSITANGSNTLLGPYVNFASGSNIVFSVASNTLTIHTLPVVTDHGSLTGLADDDHSAYLKTTLGAVHETFEHGNLGTSETIDLADGNDHTGTLNANCTISFTGWTPNKYCEIAVKLSEDSTGGHTPTFSGVTWIGGSAPSHPTTANTSTEYTFWSRDGTTVYGGQVGGSSVSELDDLSDVTITSPQEDDDLRYNGSAWVNDARKWEVVTNGEDVLVWQSNDLVFEWSS